MAIKNLLPLIVFFSAQAQVLPEIHECTYERIIEKNGTLVRSIQRERCVEDSQREIRPVRIGDVIRSNQVNPHPIIRNDFFYQQTRCRWFAELNAAQRDLVQFQGIMCEVQSNVWRVIDKF
jgi:hypothetical protein